MDITITRHGHSSHGEVFTSRDIICGIVKLSLQQDTLISKITISLRGKLQVGLSYPSPNLEDYMLWASDKHKLFKRSCRLFHCPGTTKPGKGFQFRRGVHCYPFETQFPILSCCRSRPGIPHLKTTLPPSVDSRYLDPNRGGGKLHIRYFLRVKVCRPGRLRRDKKFEEDLSFLPLDPVLPPPMLQPAVARHGGRLVTLETFLPSPAVLRSGGPLPVDMAIGIRFRQHNSENRDGIPIIILHSLRFAVMTETTLTLGSCIRKRSVSQDMLHIQNQAIHIRPGNRVGEENLDPTIWKDVIIPTAITPSFTTCTARQQHFLVITADVSLTGRPETENLETTSSIEIHSGITPRPDIVVIGGQDENHYDEAECIIPWRHGSRNHLGLPPGNDA